MKLTYHRCDDCLPPDLTIPDNSIELLSIRRMSKITRPIKSVFQKRNLKCGM